MNQGFHWEPATDAQRAALDSEADILSFGGSAGSLKTETMLMDAVQEYENPNLRGIIFRASFAEMHNHFLAIDYGYGKSSSSAGLYVRGPAEDRAHSVIPGVDPQRIATQRFALGYSHPSACGGLVAARMTARSLLKNAPKPRARRAMLLISPELYTRCLTLAVPEHGSSTSSPGGPETGLKTLPITLVAGRLSIVRFSDSDRL